jgi:hypothetical protein
MLILEMEGGACSQEGQKKHHARGLMTGVLAITVACPAHPYPLSPTSSAQTCDCLPLTVEMVALWSNIAV